LKAVRVLQCCCNATVDEGLGVVWRVFIGVDASLRTQIKLSCKVNIRDM
jgi:hypothetical protein